MTEAHRKAALKYIREKLVKGLCGRCGKRKLKTKTMCRMCSEKHNMRRRKKKI